ncbi:MAG: helix-turn-helix domain-containing protein [Mucilaginibacter sp.]|jgi:transcriptional regulator with XRE-family HTH domain
MMEKRKEIAELTTDQLASNIRKAREYRNYTQEYLAYKLRISQNAYSKIELGHTKLTVDRLFQIAEVLEFDPVSMMKPWS